MPSVFAKHLKPNTEKCVNVGTENQLFEILSQVTTRHKIAAPIHNDSDDRNKNTQSVERSHSNTKTRLRSGRGVWRHNLQWVMNLEDFVWN